MTCSARLWCGCAFGTKLRLVLIPHENRKGNMCGIHFLYGVSRIWIIDWWVKFIVLCMEASRETFSLYQSGCAVWFNKVCDQIQTVGKLERIRGVTARRKRVVLRAPAFGLVRRIHWLVVYRMSYCLSNAKRFSTKRHIQTIEYMEDRCAKNGGTTAIIHQWWAERRQIARNSWRSRCGILGAICVY